MALSRKHYKAIASIIKDNSHTTFIDDGYNFVEANIIYKDDFIYDLCKAFKQDNILFNCDRFVDACNDE